MNTAIQYFGSGLMLNELRMTVLAHGLTDKQLETISETCQRRFIAAGEQLCARNDVLDEMFIVEQGCLRGVIGPEHNRRFMGFVNTGETIGQYCMLLNEPLMADIEAEFDTWLMVLPRNQVMRIADEIPQFRENLVRSFKQRLRNAVLGVRNRRFARLVGIVRFPGCPSDPIQKIVEFLIDRGEKIKVITDEPVQSETVQISTFEQARLPRNGRLQIEAHFDRGVIDLNSDEIEQQLETFDICDEILWFFASDRPDTTKPLDYLHQKLPRVSSRVHRVCLLPDGERVAPSGLADPRIKNRDFLLPAQGTGGSNRLYMQGIARLARHLCDIKLGISLAGGGARGLFHFGVLKELDRHGISFDIMSGTSAGAMFGLSYASGLEPDYCIEQYLEKLTPPSWLRRLKNGNQWFLLWNYRMGGWDRMLRGYFHDWNVEQLAIPFYSVSVDLVAGEQYVRDSGDIITAMLESINLPVISKPILKDGKALIDGGILNNLPADVLVDHNADYVVGVDVSDELAAKYGKNTPFTETSRMKQAGTLEMLFRIVEVMGSGTAELQRSAIDQLINPDLAEFSFSDFTRGRELAELGQQLTEPLIPDIQQQINDLLTFRRNEG